MFIVGLPDAAWLCGAAASLPPLGDGACPSQQDNPGYVFIIKTNKTNPYAALFTMCAREEPS